MDDKITIPLIILNEKDNVGVALKDISEGDYTLNIFNIKKRVKVKKKIKVGFKVSLKFILKNDYIYKYGEIIGIALTNIEPGEEIHIHNMQSLIKNDDKRV